jgi:hypothetical protein
LAAPTVALGVTAADTTTIQLNENIANGGTVSGVIDILFPASGQERIVHYKTYMKNAGTGTNVTETGTGRWKNTADQLVKISLVLLLGSLTGSVNYVSLETLKTY